MVNGMVEEIQDAVEARSAVSAVPTYSDDECNTMENGDGLENFAESMPSNQDGTLREVPETSQIRLATPEETASLARESGPPDFIQTYAQYADVLEAPREMHEAVAVQVLATILNKAGVFARLEGWSFPLDLWIVLLSGSGLGRSTLVQSVDPVLEMSELKSVVKSSHWGSPQAFYQQMADHRYGLFVWGELSVMLKLLNESRFTNVKEWLTDRYDSRKIPDQITYVSRGKSTDTQPIIFSCAPRINILATSSEEWFFQNLALEDSAGGFVPRWVLIRASDPHKAVPVPPRLDPDLQESLALLLLYASELKGEADLSGIRQPYEEWYRAAQARFETQPDQALARAFFNRHRGHVLKLAVVYEVSSSLSLNVSCGFRGKAVTIPKLIRSAFRN
jgi:hypothetical protein